MDYEFVESRLDYHKFLHEQLTNQLSEMQKIAKENGVISFEMLQENELIRDVLLLKFILFQRTLKKVGFSTLERRYNLHLKSFPWLQAEYYDQNCVVHYDCIWSLLQNLKPMKRQIERIKKYDDTNHFEQGEDMRCSFCGKSQQEVERMIAAAHESICSECVALCSAILDEDRAEELSKTPPQK